MSNTSLPLTDANAYTGPMACAMILTDPEAAPEEVEAAAAAMFANGWDFLIYDLHLCGQVVSEAANNYCGPGPRLDHTA